MAKDRDDEQQNFTLEEILAEYGVDVSRWEEDGKDKPAADPGPDLPWPEAKHTPPPQNVVLFPGMTAPPEEDEADGGEEEDAPAAGEPEEEAPPPPRETPRKAPVTDKVL